MPHLALLRTGLTLVAVLACAPGCGTATRPIVPDAPAGRRALDLAMASWKAGRLPGMLDAQEPQIQVVDSFRKPGQTLRTYRILSEIADERTRAFTLLLEFNEDAPAETARFLLVGIDPILVFREQDYELLTHFEHKMDGPEASGK